MANRSILSRMIFTVSLVTVIPNIHTASAAISTDRLSPGQLRVWNSIRDVVFAKDGSGRLLHARLHELWHSVESSGHLIFIELPKQAENSTTKAGDMAIEKVDPLGDQHIIVVRLFLSTINRAYAEKEHPLDAEQFAPLAGLSRNARYAEVLGHELAHVERLLADPDYRSLYAELDRELSSYFSSRNNQTAGNSNQEAQRHLERIELLENEVERPAVAAEAQIWRELIAGEGGKMGGHNDSHGITLFATARMGGK